MMQATTYQQSLHISLFFSCTLPSSFLMAYLLFIEQDVGTDIYITESHSIYAFTSLFIMIIVKMNSIKSGAGNGRWGG